MKANQSKFDFYFRVLGFFLIFNFLISCSSSDSNDSVKPSIAGEVTTLAGGVSSGNADGTGLSAKFNRPIGLCFDANDNLLIADSENDRIRKATLAGVVTTLAGSTPGAVDDIISMAQFDTPFDLCRDSNGNIFVADFYNHKIRKITTTGYVSTFAGSTDGFADGIGTSAKFSRPNSICIDAANNLYVGDLLNDMIRKITPNGTVTTIAGSTNGESDGIGSAAQFSNVQDICIDTQGNLYVVDNSRIRKINPVGAVTTIAGSTLDYVDGNLADAKFNSPHGIAVDPQGNLYVADTSNRVLRKITPGGIVSTLAGSTAGRDDGIGAAAKFNSPRQLCYHKGILYMTDVGNHNIRIIQ